MKLHHPEIVPLSKGIFFTSVCSNVILKKLGQGVHFKMKLPVPEMMPLSKGNFFTSVCSRFILESQGSVF